MKHPRVAVVDDDPDWQNLLKLTLHKFGLETQTFPSAEAAWEFMSQHPAHFHYFLLDFNLKPGGWTGGELAHHLRTTESAPIVILSSDAGIEKVVEDMRGATAISKRLPFETILEKLRTFFSVPVGSPT